MTVEVWYHRSDGQRESTLCWDLDDLALVLEGLADDGSQVIAVMRRDEPEVAKWQIN